MSKLTFDELTTANVERNKASFRQCAGWGLTDWGVALAGEVGEACNIIKKLKRISWDLRPEAEAERERLTVALGKEFADVQTYLVLAANHIGIDLGNVTAAKFNEVSDRVGSPIRLAVHE